MVTDGVDFVVHDAKTVETSPAGTHPDHRRIGSKGGQTILPVSFLAVN